MSDARTLCLQYLEKSGQALGVAQDLLDKVHQEKQAAAQLSADLVDRLAAEKQADGSTLIGEHEKKSALKQLGDHAGAVKLAGQLLTALARQKKAYEQKLALRQGQADSGATTKKASAGSSTGGSRSNPNYVGRRLGLGEKSAADLAFEQRLLGASS